MKQLKQSIKFIAVAVLMVSVYSCFNDPVTPVDYSNYTQQREDSIVSTIITSWVDKGYHVDTSSLGVYYTLFDEGDSVLVQPGDSVGVIYTGYMADGSGIFDESATWYPEDSIWHYRYLTNELIPGFDESIGQMSEGAYGYFLIPSILAYGSSGSGLIPPYSPLVFKIKMVDIYE